MVSTTGQSCCKLLQLWQWNILTMLCWHPRITISNLHKTHKKSFSETMKDYTTYWPQGGKTCTIACWWCLGSGDWKNRKLLDENSTSDRGRFVGMVLVSDGGRRLIYWKNQMEQGRWTAWQCLRENSLGVHQERYSRKGVVKPITPMVTLVYLPGFYSMLARKSFFQLLYLQWRAAVLLALILRLNKLHFAKYRWYELSVHNVSSSYIRVT